MTHILFVPVKSAVEVSCINKSIYNPEFTSFETIGFMRDVEMKMLSTSHPIV